MNDDFLYQSRPQLRSEFAKMLFVRISRDMEGNNTTKFTTTRLNILRWAKSIAIILLFTLSATLLVSKEARARFAYLIQEISGFLFEETDQFPFSDHPERDYQELPNYELAQAQEMLPFSLVLPTYVPEGYKFSENIGIACKTSCATLIWQNGTYDTLMLLIQLEENYPDWPEPVGYETVEEVYVNGKIAALIRGAWNFETELWDENFALRLKWELDGLVYGLSWRPSNSGKNTAYKLSVEDIILIAQSIR